MTHNKFLYSEDFLKPFQNFLFTHEIVQEPTADYVFGKVLRPKKKNKENLNPTEVLKSLKRADILE